ncbi:unnamed protein product [Mycena citricolor]|uniref:Uncharacterized protein n=1 Tax=Mycena citricolor TaxID=2018698 RepID=A0AAD2HU62_9AGAR|nr:unnamed protein product [Mycena citricolor]
MEEKVVFHCVVVLRFFDRLKDCRFLRPPWHWSDWTHGPAAALMLAPVFFAARWHHHLLDYHLVLPLDLVGMGDLVRDGTQRLCFSHHCGRRNHLLAPSFLCDRQLGDSLVRCMALAAFLNAKLGFQREVDAAPGVGQARQLVFENAQTRAAHQASLKAPSDPSNSSSTGIHFRTLTTK